MGLHPKPQPPLVSTQRVGLGAGVGDAEAGPLGVSNKDYVHVLGLSLARALYM